LSDQLLAAVSRAKVAKNKIEERKWEDQQKKMERGKAHAR